MTPCIFCSIVKDNEPHHEIIWSHDSHIAFLAVPPTREGHALVIPKEHVANISDLSPAQYTDLFAAAREVGLLLQSKLECDRVAMVTEGASIAHAHIHLIPLRAGEELASFTSHPQSSDELAATAQKIKNLS